MRAYLELWRHYSDFSGRTNVADFWKAYFVHLIIGVSVAIISSVFLIAGLHFDAEKAYFSVQIVNALYCLASLIPWLAITVRRLRDGGYSPKGLFWLLVPGIGIIALLVRLCAKSAVLTNNSEIINRV